LGDFRKARFLKRGLNTLLLLTFLLLPSLSASSEPIDVNGLRYWSYPEYTRVVIDLSGSTHFTKKRIAKPDRLFFDLENSYIEEELKSGISIDDGMLKAVRVGQFTKNSVRVVLDLGKVNNYNVFTLEDPSRIVVDIYGPKVFSEKTRIVLDPGHGGKDPGAIGSNKLYEKDVVLDIAQRLKKILVKDNDLEVFMTRDRDVFISLEERTAIANSKSADLFISIHANASKRRNLKGIETYFLNWTDNEEWMKVAARENAISLKQMKKIQKKHSVLDVILNDLDREHKRDESLALAHYVQNSLVNELDRSYRHINDLGVKSAPFYVLFGAEMSAILVEVSFISNPLEAKLLKKNTYRNELARSLATGIQKFMLSSPKSRMVADSGKTIASRD
jgi:N-acetylmuramoyl-L-alanine amidase